MRWREAFWDWELEMFGERGQTEVTTSSDFLLTVENVATYLADVGLVGADCELRVRELGGGVSNVVLLIEAPGPSGLRWVIKQSLAKLRVKDDWRSARERIFREAECIQMLQPVLQPGSVPEVVHVDRKNFLFIMTAAPLESCTWKSLLLSGNIDLSTAAEVGRLLALIIVASQRDSGFQRRFADQTVFDQLRLDPYYRTAARRQPDVAAKVGALMADSSKIRTALVHGDYSPKNILSPGQGIVLIDFEVVHWGDPAFDSGFLLNHLVLKAVRRPQLARHYLDAAGKFWSGLLDGLGPAGDAGFELMTVRHLGALMLARIDGKSPVEYIQKQEIQAQVRRLAKRILLEQPSRLNVVFEWVLSEAHA
jgi:5-methylthioribose kinase